MSRESIDEDIDRPRGILTRADREFLANGEESYSRQAAHERRKAIRERVTNALQDFTLLCELEKEERNKIFPEPGTAASRRVEAAVSDAIKFLYLGMEGSLGFSRPLKQGVANGEVQRGGVRSAFDVAVRFTIDPVWKADIETVTDLVERDQWDRLERSDLPPFVSVAKRAGAIDFDKIRAELAENEWFQKYRLGKKSREIPGGHSTPLMDPEVYEREGIGNMSPEELQELFGEGYPGAPLASPIYDGEKVFRPPPLGTDGEIEILEWIDEPDENDQMPTEGGIYDPTDE